LGLAFEGIVFELDDGVTRVPAVVLEPLRCAIKRMGVSSFDADTVAAWQRVQRASEA
jgi:hypothetical protein